MTVLALFSGVIYLGEGSFDFRVGVGDRANQIVFPILWARRTWECPQTEPYVDHWVHLSF